MDWVPIVFIVFKVAVFGTGMFFAIKWHYDQGRKRRAKPADCKCRLNARRARRSRGLMPRDGLSAIRLLPTCITPWPPVTKTATAPSSTNPLGRPWPACGSPSASCGDEGHAAHPPRDAGLRLEVAGH